MKNLTLNVVSFIIIGIGGLLLTSTSQANKAGGCSTGWELSCIDDGAGTICCTRCNGDPSTGECQEV